MWVRGEAENQKVEVGTVPKTISSNSYETATGAAPALLQSAQIESQILPASS